MIYLIYICKYYTNILVGKTLPNNIIMIIHVDDWNVLTLGLTTIKV